MSKDLRGAEIRGIMLMYRPWRDGRLSWPSWLTHRGQFMRTVVTCQPQNGHNCGESLLAKDRHLNHWAMPPNRFSYATRYGKVVERLLCVYVTVAAEIIALVRTLVLFHYDADAQKLQSQFDRYLRLIDNSFGDVWNDDAACSAAADLVIATLSSFITPYRQNKNTYYTHTVNAIYTVKTKNAKKETWQ